MRKLHTIFPAAADAHDRTFNLQIEEIRNRNIVNLLCHNPAAHLNPENIVRLGQLWTDINRTLSQVGTASTNYQDKETVTVRVLEKDIESIIKDLDVCRIGMSTGKR